MLSSVISYITSLFKNTETNIIQWRPREIHISQYLITLHRILRDSDQATCISNINDEFEYLIDSRDYPFSDEVIEKAVDMVYTMNTKDGYKGYIIVEDVPYGKRIYMREQ